MIFHNVKLKNWRNFRNVDVNLTPRVFIVGPNASGKSNFLDVFKFLRDIAKPGGGLQTAIEYRGGIKKIRCLSARTPSLIEIIISITDKKDKIWRYELGIKQEQRKHHRPILNYERVYLNEKNLLNRPDEKDNRDSELLTQTALEQIVANEKFRELTTFFKNISYLHILPQIIRRPELFPWKGVGEDFFGWTLLKKIASTTDRTRDSRLRKIGNALKQIVPQMKELKFIKDEEGKPHLETRYEHWRKYGARQNEMEFSDGTLRLIGFFWALLDGNGPLLFEEPELYLHSKIVKSIPFIIQKMQKKNKRQVIISTHSIEMLEHKEIGGEEILLLEPSKEGTKIKQVSSIEEIKNLLENEISPGEAIEAYNRRKSEPSDELWVGELFN